MLRRLADLSLRRPRRVLVATGLFVLVAGLLGGPAPGLLKAPHDFDATGSAGYRAQRLVEHATGIQAAPGVLVLVHAGPRSPVTAEAARQLAADPAVGRVIAPAQGGPTMVSRDGRSSLLAASLRAEVDEANAANQLIDRAKGHPEVLLGGASIAGREVGRQANQDLSFGEALAFPLLTLLALLIFRGWAALLPLAIGATSVLGAFLALRGINGVVALSPFALNLVIGVGLGLAIDYSLFVVSRYREEIGRGADAAAAVRTTMATAGRTVVFSAITVAAAMITLTVFPLRFLQSMGIGGAVVALVAGATSLIVLPALLVLLGRRIGRHVPPADREGRWYRLAHGVMRRPGAVAGLTAIALLALAAPTLGTHWSGVDASDLPSSQSARVLQDTVARDFPRTDAAPMFAVTRAPESAGPQLAAYAARLRTVGGVVGVGAPRALPGGLWRTAVSASGESIAPAAQRTLAAVRALPAPGPTLVGGSAASFADRQGVIGATLPLALGLLVVLTLSILWVMTGSVLLPIKTLLMNLLTVGAATGLLVLVFQDGRLTGLLDYTPQGGLETTDFLVLVAVVFALSTDYGVFLLTRIREARMRGLGEREAVAAGVQRTGSIVSAAAILLAVAIGAFATSKIIFLKEVGLGTATAVLLDAFVVRALLVPALMALLGRWNWWSPALLRRLHARLDVGEGEAPRAAGEAGRPAPTRAAS